MIVIAYLAPGMTHPIVATKDFYGTSENAIKVQIWIAVSFLLAIMKKLLKIEAGVYTILQILSVTIFERIT